MKLRRMRTENDQIPEPGAPQPRSRRRRRLRSSHLSPHSMSVSISPMSLDRDLGNPVSLPDFASQFRNFGTPNAKGDNTSAHRDFAIRSAIDQPTSSPKPVSNRGNQPKKPAAFSENFSLPKVSTRKSPKIKLNQSTINSQLTSQVTMISGNNRQNLVTTKPEPLRVCTQTRVHAVTLNPNATPYRSETPKPTRRDSEQTPSTQKRNRRRKKKSPASNTQSATSENHSDTRETFAIPSGRRRCARHGTRE